MGKKKKKKRHPQLSFTQEIGKVLHQKGTEIALALVTGILTNLMTDASEKLFERYVHKHKPDDKT